MVFITAANSAYFRALKNLVGSIHYWAPGYGIVVYDLGLSENFLKEVSQWSNTSVIRDFLPENSPPHVRDIHNYAWKPICLKHAIQSHSTLLWIDAGSDLRAPVTGIARHLEEDGHFFVQGQDIDMTLMSHERVYEALGVRKVDFEGRQHFAGNLQGYLRDSDAHIRVLNPMCDYAVDEECIAPEGSNLSNHRFDQTLLSILIYRSDMEATPHTELLSARREELSPNPANPSSAAVYTARGTSREYESKIRLWGHTQATSGDPSLEHRKRRPGSWSPPDDLKDAALTVVACTSHFFSKSYVTPFRVPGEWGIDVSCNFTSDPALLGRADAWWFHGPSITQLPKHKDRPWILMSMESDRSYPLLRNPEVLDMFDIHMTYRLDSDVPTPYPNWSQYGDFKKPPIPVEEKNRHAPAVYIASNAVDYRDAYVLELMTHMPVDSLGKCLNNKNIESFVAGENVWQRGGFFSILDLLPKYKFYLVFENSLTADYVTERLFHALAAGTVPVYYGAGNVEEFLPGNDAVIKVTDFAGPGELADYLLYLDRNDRAYQRYLAWKECDYADGFRKLLDIGTIEPRYRMAVKLAHGCARSCGCGGRIRAPQQE